MVPGSILPTRCRNQVDKNGDGKISEKEYKDTFGVTLDEFKKRARDKSADWRRLYGELTPPRNDRCQELYNN